MGPCLRACLAIVSTWNASDPAERSSGAPRAFVENAGQWSDAVRFSSEQPGVRAFFTRGGVTLELRAPGAREPRPDAHAGCTDPARALPARLARTTLHLGLDGARPDATIEGLEPLPGRCSFFRGNDPARWVTGARTFARVRYREVLSGVDLEAYSSGSGLEYDLVLHPGAASEDVVLRLDGAERLVEEDGALVAETAIGRLRQSAPRVQVCREGRWLEIPGRFRRIDAERFGFELEGRASDEPCRIDPELAWSTLLGGSGEDQVVAAVVDSGGCPILTGYTDSSDFPFPTPIPSPGGDWDVFVTRLAPDASTVLYSAVFGGSFSTQSADSGGGPLLPGNEGGGDIAVDSAGRITLIGLTGSEDFPTTSGAFDRTYNGGVELNELGDTFLVRLDPSLAGAAQLVYSTYLGGALIDNGFDLVVEPNGHVTIAGHCHSPEFPTTPGAYQPVIDDPTPGDAFVCRLALNGAGASDLLWSTFLGGSGYDYGYGLALDATGRALVAGDAGIPPDFPVTPGSFDTTHNGAPEGFVAILDPAIPGAAQLRYGTYLGGSRRETLYDLAALPSGDVVVAGYTLSPDLPVKPVPGAFDTTFNGAFDVFVARLSPHGNGADDLTWCTYLGGSGAELAQRVRVRPSGAVTVAGYTTSTDFPVSSGAVQPAYGGGAFDAFLARIGAHGDRLACSTFLGGAGSDQALGLALDTLGNAIVVGGTGSFDFPVTPGVVGSTHSGGPLDGFVARLCPEDCATSASVSSSAGGIPGVAGVPVVTAVGRPVLGNGEFALALSSAAPLASGAWLVESLPGSAFGPSLGSHLRSVLRRRIELTTDAQGRALLPWPVECSARACGAALRVRAVVEDAAAPGGRSASGWCLVQFGD